MLTVPLVASSDRLMLSRRHLSEERCFQGRCLLFARALARALPVQGMQNRLDIISCYPNQRRKRFFRMRSSIMAIAGSLLLLMIGP